MSESFQSGPVFQPVPSQSRTAPAPGGQQPPALAPGVPATAPYGQPAAGVQPPAPPATARPYSAPPTTAASAPAPSAASAPGGPAPTAPGAAQAYRPPTASTPAQSMPSAATPHAAHVAPSQPSPAGPQPGPGAPAAGGAAPPLPQARSAGPQPPSAAAPAARIGMSQERQASDVDLDELLVKQLDLGASDLHLTSGAPPTVRLDGTLQALEGYGPLDAEGLQRSLYSVLTQRQREKFEADLELDFAYAVRGKARFRVNMYFQRDSVGAAFRVIPYEIRALDTLGLPPVVANFAGLPRGLVLVTGPTGSGKSTTLASIIDLANRTRAEHIMTVEDPIEFLHRHKKAIVNQREVGEDTHSFANALKHVLRQDPDIILVGEMRDLETISVALTAAETGHLVFATLHTQDAAQTIDRIIDVFPAEQQAQIRTQLASAIQGVVSQTLCKRASGRGRVIATEVLLATPAVRNLIREGNTHQIYSAMQAGAAHGMHTMDQHLGELVKNGSITYETGLEKAHHVEDFNRIVGRSASMAQGSGGMSDPMSMSGGAMGMPRQS